MSNSEKKLVDPELKAVSDEIKQLFESSGLEVYIPNFVSEAQAGGYRLLGFGVKDPNDYRADYEVGVWPEKQIYFKSIWPTRNEVFEQKLKDLLATKGYTKTRFATYTH